MDTKVFDGLPQCHDVFWTIMIVGYSHNGFAIGGREGLSM